MARETEILQKLTNIETAIAIHNEHHTAQDETVAKHEETLYGDGRRGLVTKVAIHGWMLASMISIGVTTLGGIGIYLFSQCSKAAQ